MPSPVIQFLFRIVRLICRNKSILKIMRNRLLLTAIGASAIAFSAVSCETDRHAGNWMVSEAAVRSFDEMYPGAKDIEWEIKGKYAVADFRYTSRGEDKTAWFLNEDGSWGMTETDITYDQLPQAVRTSFESGEYASWRIDDIDMLERAGVEDIYVIEVEGRSETGETEADLYYSADGTLVKEVIGAEDGYDYEDFIPDRPESGMEEFIEAKYPGARIIDIDNEGGYTEISIIHENIEKDIYFNGAEEWVRSEWDIRYSELPEAVRTAIQNNYPGYEIDDITFVESPQGSWYKVELEERSGDRDITVRISGSGDILR